MRTILYYLGLSFLFTHEMDAVMRMEWQLLFLLRDMSDESAYSIFLALHVPAFFLFFWLGHHPNIQLQSLFRKIAAIFLVVHACIHYYNADFPANHFEGLLSNGLIYGAGVLGLLYVIPYRRRHSTGAA